MVKQYVLLSNTQREELCRLIHTEGLNIKQAALLAGVPYANAKAVNKTFVKEKRSEKKHMKYRQVEGVKPNELAQILYPRKVPKAKTPYLPQISCQLLSHESRENSCQASGRVSSRLPTDVSLTLLQEKRIVQENPTSEPGSVALGPVTCAPPLNLGQLKSRTLIAPRNGAALHTCNSGIGLESRSYRAGPLNYYLVGNNSTTNSIPFAKFGGPANFLPQLSSPWVQS